MQEVRLLLFRTFPYTAFVSHPYLPQGQRLAFAHRGGSKLWPENTLEAFGGALEIGIRWIETDVHLSSDGEIVIFHDENLERCTNGRGPIAAQPYAELEKLDAGFHFTRGAHEFPFRGQGVKIPRLLDALALHPDLKLNIEMKPDKPVMAQRLAELIEKEGVQDRVLVASAKTSVLRQFRQFQPNIVTSASMSEIACFLAASHVGLTKRLKLPYKALQVPMGHYGIPVVSRRFIRAAHEADIRVHVWTVDDRQLMNRLHELEVDGIMSDRPDILMHSFAEN